MIVRNLPTLTLQGAESTFASLHDAFSASGVARLRAALWGIGHPDIDPAAPARKGMAARLVARSFTIASWSTGLENR